jgi:ubiquitin C-terminal hydrolase
MNSVLQILFHCAPFRKRMRRYATDRDEKPTCLCTHLANMFDAVVCSKARTGVVSPTSFLRKLANVNEIFQPGVQQDAHEFLNFLLNNVSDRVRAIDKSREFSTRQEDG